MSQQSANAEIDPFEGVELPEIEDPEEFDPLFALKLHERKFVTEYFRSGSPRQAALSAGYSMKVACGTAYDLVGKSRERAFNKRIWDAVYHIRKQIEEEAVITEAEIFARYRALAFADTRRLYRGDGTLKDIHDLDDNTAAAIKSVKIEEGPTGVRVSEIKLTEPKAALDSLAKVKGMFTEKVEVSGTVTHQHGLSSELQEKLDEIYQQTAGA